MIWKLALLAAATLAPALPGELRVGRAAVKVTPPAGVRVAAAREDSVSFIRRYYMKDGTVGWNPGKNNPNILAPVGTIDSDVSIVSFETPAGKPLAAYVNFACHLDTVGGMQFSADY